MFLHKRKKKSYKSGYRKMAIVDVLGPLFLFSLLFFTSAVTSSVSDSEALLRLKQSFTNSTHLDSWLHGTDACAKNRPWIGVICDKGVVTGIRLGQMGLSGKIDVGALLLIPTLRSISFIFNSFSGPIPEFNQMGALKGIYLMGNQFSGEIPPDYFFRMQSLRKLWLSRNRFSGQIPPSLAQVPNLIELHLEGNQFSGWIPSLAQPTLKSFNVSGNSLTGKIPPELSNFSADSFQGNSGLCGGNLGISCEQNEGSSSSPPSASSNHNSSSKIAVGFLITASVVLLITIIGIIALLRRKNQPRENQPEKEDLGKPVTAPPSLGASSKKEMNYSRKGSGSSRRGSGQGNKGIGDLVMVNEERGVFGFADLMKAGAEVLGSGASGSSYKATMANGLTVVVKRIKEMSKIGKDRFDEEIRRLGRLKHKSILTPLAYHYRKDEKLLVSEYIPNGSLLYLLHGDRGLGHAALNWPIRLKIIQGIAQGLGYLHKELSSLNLPHGNLKSSNVLLSPDHEPMLVDYGLDFLLGSSQATQSLMAYRAPEAVQHHQISPQCDVYCLGIIILELITGKFPSQYLNNGKGGTDIVQWVKSAIAEGREVELLDPDIASAKDSPKQMEQILHIGAACVETNPIQRIDLREAISRIEEACINNQEGKTFQVTHIDAASQVVNIDDEGHLDRENSWRSREGTEDRAGHRLSGSFDRS